MDQLYKKYRTLWVQPSADGRFVGNGRVHCCVDMTAAVTFGCEQHVDPCECPDHLIAYNEITDEYGLAIHDGGASVLIIRHCPFCGAVLPESQADRWFDEIEALGFKSFSDDAIPTRYKTDAWRRSPNQPQDR